MLNLVSINHLQAMLAVLGRLLAWLVLISVVFMPLERLFAVRRRSWRSLPGDIGFFLISGVVPGLLLTPLLALGGLAAQSVVPAGLHAAVAGLPLWARAGLALVVSEAGFYWGHRWSHEIPFLWRFHAVHHKPEEVYFLVSARAHPFDNVFIRLCGLLPVYALGLATPLTPAGGAVSALLVIIMTLWGFLIHANIRWRFGLLERLVATPAFHHWHHTRGEPRDRNYASVLPCMDMLFGTWHLPRAAWPEAYGTQTPMPASVAGQLVAPLLPQRGSRRGLPPSPRSLPSAGDGGVPG